MLFNVGRQNNELAYLSKYEIDFDDLKLYIMRFDDAEHIYWVILMHRNQLKVKIVNF